MLYSFIITGMLDKLILDGLDKRHDEWVRPVGPSFHLFIR